MHAIPPAPRHAPPVLSVIHSDTLNLMLPSLHQAYRAFAFGYLWIVAPRLTAIISMRLRQLWLAQKFPNTHLGRGDGPGLLKFLARVLRRPLGLRSFPFFCAVLIGGSSLLEVSLNRFLDHFLTSTHRVGRKRLSRWLAAFSSAWVGIRLLQTRLSSQPQDGPLEMPPQPELLGTVDGATSVDLRGIRRNSMSGRYVTQDLTLLALTRSIDVAVGTMWAHYRPRRGLSAQLASGLSVVIDPILFVASSAVIMWSFVYAPSSLPPAYTRWISTAAAVDGRLLETLVRIRRGRFVYGVESGQSGLLGSMCSDYGWPLVWGDPARTWPVPCEMVHMGFGPSCEQYAISRFLRSWAWAMATYLPLGVVLLLRRRSSYAHRNAGLTAFGKAFVSAARSSAFLGAFIALFCYGVCLTRTRLGPCLLLHGSKSSCQALDGGACIAAGCGLCGWSILIEPRTRRGELSLFVVPRALAALLRTMPLPCLHSQKIEALMFATCAAVILTCAREDSRRVRGFLGSVLQAVIKP